MKIKQLVLNDFLLVKDSGIAKMTVNFNSDIQLIIGSNGSGKALDLDTLIKTPDGWVRMGDIKVDQQVIAVDGSTTKVTGVFPQGKLQLYKVTFSDGRSVKCCEDHLWKVYNVYWDRHNPENRWKVMSLKEIMQVQNPHMKRAGIFVPLPEPEIKEDIDLPIDPYVLGIVLGDGCIQERTVIVTNPELFIQEEVDRLLPEGYRVSPRRYDNKCNAFGIIRSEDGKGASSSFCSLLGQLDLKNSRSWNKHIPDIYLEASSSQRLALLQGLMDTDGHISTYGKNRNGTLNDKGIGHLEYCTTSERLAYHIQYLIRSLGGLCKIRTKVPYFTHKGERRQGRLAYYLNIRVKDPSSVFRLPKKKERASGEYQFKDRLRLRIISIEPWSVDEAQCISVDHPDKLFVVQDFIVTHNTQVSRQLSSYPSSRSLFGKKGYKSLTIEKDGFTYRLESEYEKPSSPHGFYEGDSSDNINVGRTTDVQKELIVEHLGITPLVDDLIMNRYVFPKWKPAQRKEFLMNNNPSDIGFIAQDLKRVSSKIRACKNNIARLQSRKILLEQDLLSDEDLINLENEKLKIDNDLTFFQKQIMDLDIGSKVIGHIEQVSLSVNPFKQTLRSIRMSLHRYSHVSRDNSERTNLKNILAGRISSKTARTQEIHDLIISQTEELTDLEIQYRALTPDGNLQEIENTLTRLELDRDKLRTTKPDIELSRTELQSYYGTLEELGEVLSVFTNLEGKPLYTSRKRRHRERLLNNAKYKLSRYEMTLSDLRSQYEDLSKRHSMSPADIPDAPCAKNACPLYAHFMEGYEHTEERRQSVKSRIDKGERFHKRLEMFVTHMTRYFNTTQMYHDKIQWLVTESQSNPILRSVLKSLDILSTLMTSPHRIYQRLKDNYDHIDQWLKYKDVLEQIDITNTLKQRCMGSQSHDTIKLVVSIENLKKSLVSLRDELTAITATVRTDKSVLDDICAYEGIKTEVSRLQEHYQYYIKYLSDKHELDKIAFLKKSLEDLRSDTYVRMSEVERTLRAQSGLKERYQEEVLNELSRIEKDMSELLLIEKALIDIPKEITIDFLNGIFEQANKIIDAVWTIPFRIEPLTYDSDLNYEFMVSGDNQTLREMSECSEGQTEILSLAINLALRIELGHLDIPIVLDETGRTFDEKHKQNLVFLLKKLLDEKIISQLFLISHHAIIHDSFSNIETLVIREDNVMLPQEYNLHAEIS